MNREDMSLADALERANLVVLVSALAHRTGDRTLLSRYPVAKFERGWNADGFSKQEKAQIRAHALGLLRSLECRDDVHDEYNRRVDEAHEGLVWRHPKVHSYYNHDVRAGSRRFRHPPLVVVHPVDDRRGAPTEQHAARDRHGGPPVGLGKGRLSGFDQHGEPLLRAD